VFFPANDALAGLPLAVSIFGISVVARPLGGALFGAFSHLRPLKGP
jgi:hypothetical protein